MPDNTPGILFNLLPALTNFDACWRINPDFPTVILLGQEIGALPEFILDSGNKRAAQEIIGIYRDAEAAFRFYEPGAEQMNAYGIYSMWVIANTMNRFSQTLLNYREDLPESSQVFTTEESMRVLIAGLYHNFLGVNKQDIMANPKTIEVRRILYNMFAFREASMRGILRLIRTTDFNIDSQNPVRYNQDGRYHIALAEMDMSQLLVVFGNLMRIGALDYWQMFQKIFGLDHIMPSAQVVVTVGIVKELARRLHSNPPILVVPEAIRDNVINSLTTAGYYHPDTMYLVPGTDERRFTPQSLIEFSKQELGLLGEGAKLEV